MFGIFVEFQGGYFPPIPENNSFLLFLLAKVKGKKPSPFWGEKKILAMLTVYLLHWRPWDLGANFGMAKWLHFLGSQRSFERIGHGKFTNSKNGDVGFWTSRSLVIW